MYVFFVQLLGCSSKKCLFKSNSSMTYMFRILKANLDEKLSHVDPKGRLLIYLWFCSLLVSFKDKPTASSVTRQN